jgi:hypothetical protein
MIFSETILRGMKTFSGGLYHSLSTYPNREIHDNNNFQGLLWCLKLQKDVLYGVELSGYGFIIYTKHLVFVYKHDSFSIEKRKVELRF